MNGIVWRWHRFWEWLHTLWSWHHHDRLRHHKAKAIAHGINADEHDVRRPPLGAGSEPVCDEPSSEGWR